jgi:hypothetical protein
MIALKNNDYLRALKYANTAKEKNKGKTLTN